MEKTMRIRMILTMLLLMATVMVSAQGLKTTVDEERKAEIRKTLALDYSMPDYSTNKIDAKVMGRRLADILTKFQDMTQSQTILGTLSVIQAHQIDGMIYCAVKKIKLNNVSKHGDQIRITYDTELAQNQKALKKSKIVFTFIDSVSDDIFTNVCRYIRE